MEGKVIHRAGDEQIALPLLVEVGRVRLQVVSVDLLHGRFNFFLSVVQPDHLVLLLLNKLYGFKHSQGSSVILVPVVVVEPQVVDGQQQGLYSSSLDEVQKGLCPSNDAEDLALDHTLPLAVLDVELGALDAISPGLIAALALAVAVLFTHTALEELVLHAVGGASSALQSVALLAGSAVVGERAVRTFVGASVLNFY